jgi:hypothetical protein
MELLSEIETYLSRTGLAASKFGRLAVGDPRFVDDLRSGRRPRRRTLERVSSFLAARDAETGHAIGGGESSA